MVVPPYYGYVIPNKTINPFCKSTKVRSASKLTFPLKDGREGKKPISGPLKNKAWPSRRVMA